MASVLSSSMAKPAQLSQSSSLGAWEQVKCLTGGVNKDVIEDWESSSMHCV